MCCAFGCKSDASRTTTKPASSAYGTDANADGTWDDVEAKIEETKFSRTQKLAWKQYAHAIQEAIDESDDKHSSVENSHKMQRARGCIAAVQPDAENVGARLEEWVVTSKERLKAYLSYNSKLSGQVYQDHQATNTTAECDVDPQQIGNM